MDMMSISETKGGDIISNYKCRKEVIRIRVTLAEKKRIAEIAKKANMTMSQYIRLVMENPPDITRAEFNVLKTELVYQVKKIGVNINQIAKKYNENAWIRPSERLIDRMDELQQIVNQIAFTIYNK